MNRFNLILLPIALLFGACDEPDAADLADDAEANVEAVAAAPAAAGERGRGGPMAKLDADKDGAISLAEAQGTRLADKFSGLDRDADGKLTREELRAAHGERGEHGKRGRHGERGGKMFADRDADNSGTLSLAELQGTRLADKFATLDANKDGALAKDELGRGKHGPRDPAARAERILGKRDADNSGTLTLAELAGSRMADRFAQIDADRNSALTREELVASRPVRDRRTAR